MAAALHVNAWVRVTPLLWLLIFLAAGCGGDSSSSQSISVGEVANSTGDFAEAFANNDDSVLLEFWADTCSEQDRALAANASEFFAEFLGEDYSVQIDPGLLEIDITDSKVSVPLEQPTGAITATARGIDYVPGLPFEVPLILVREDGEWKVSSCVLFTNDDDGAEGEDTPPP